MKWQFWGWLFLGLNDRAGYRQFMDRWLIVHVLAGVGVAAVVKMPMHEAAQTILLPLAGIFIGLSFAWAGNAQALLQQNEMEEIARHHRDGLQSYIYTFQLAILVILVTLVVWGLAGLKVFDTPYLQQTPTQLFVESFLYFMASLTLRECWHVVLASQIMILSRHKARGG